MKIVNSFVDVSKRQQGIERLLIDTDQMPSFGWVIMLPATT